jgi:hypothetical protein
MHKLFIETTNKPWFGPKARAKQLLKHGKKPHVSPSKFLANLQDKLKNFEGPILGVRFIDYVDLKTDFHYTIALCWLDNDPIVREFLYSQADEITRETGWYPLVAGERLSSSLWNTELEKELSVSVPLDRSREFASASITGFRNAAGHENGSSIRLDLDNGQSILLDAGLPNSVALRTEKSQTVLISHTHLDHFGGVLHSLPGKHNFLMSHSTSKVAALKFRRWYESHLKDIQVVDEGDSFTIARGVQVSPFSVPHSLGSSGWVIEGLQNVIVYSGDISIATSRHNAMPQLRSFIHADKPTTFFLDGTMAGRALGATMKDTNLFSELQIELPVVIVGREIDHLVFAYLDVFFKSITGLDRNNVTFVVSSKAKETFQVLHSEYLKKGSLSKDAFLKGQYGSRMSAWGESRWLFWLDSLKNAPIGKAVYFLTPEEVNSPNAPKRARSIEITNRTNSRLELPAGWEEVGAFDTSPWTGHSDQDILTNAVRELKQLNAEVVLFHNFPRRLKNYAHHNNLSIRWVDSAKQSLIP